MPAHVDDLNALHHTLDAVPAHLVGHSYGAFLCLLLAIRDSRMVHGAYSRIGRTARHYPVCERSSNTAGAHEAVGKQAAERKGPLDSTKNVSELIELLP